MFVGIAINLTGRLLASASPAALFANGEIGAWYDPSDITTLFQDSAGTTPVTGPNQPVGKMLDKSGRGNHATQATSTQRPIYGINPITGTRNLLTFTTYAGASGTTQPTGWARGFGTGTFSYTLGNSLVFGQTLTHNQSVSGRSYISQTVTLTVGVPHTVSVRVDPASVFTGGNSAMLMANGFGLGGPSVGLANVVGGLLSLTFTPLSASGDIRIGLGVVGVATGTFIHASPQLELGSTRTSYQQVVSQYEVTEAGVESASYLAFDGVDDGMVTGTITPAIDKVQVFAGVRKLSDAAIGVVVELSALQGTNNGTFNIRAPNGAASASFAMFTSGTTTAAIGDTNSGNAAPVTKVVTGISNISAPSAALKLNGTQVATSTATQGTGNYLAYPLYIGRRGGTTLPYNGRLYSLIVRFGANLTTGQITSTESWVNGKTGAY